MKIRLGKLYNVTYCVFQGRDQYQGHLISNQTKYANFFQVFNICAVHAYESSKMIGDNINFRYLVKVMHYMKRSLLYGLNLSRTF